MTRLALFLMLITAPAYAQTSTTIGATFSTADEYAVVEDGSCEINAGVCEPSPSDCYIDGMPCEVALTLVGDSENDAQ